MSQMRSIFLCVIALKLFIICGCGGGEDFSKPTKALGPTQGQPEVAAAPVETPEPSSSETATPPAAEPAALPSATENEVPAVTAQPEAKKPETAVGNGSGLMSAGNASDSGKANAPVEPAKEEKPAKGGGGLLGMLGGKSATPDAPPSATSDTVPIPVNTIAADFSDHGDFLVAEREKGQLGVFDVINRTSLMSLSATEDDITKLHFDASRNIVAAVLPSGKIDLWQYQSTVGLDRFAKETAAEEAYLKTLDGHSGGTLDIAFSPTREELVSAGTDGAVRFWRLRDAKSSKTFTRTGPELKFVVASASGSHVAALTAVDTVTIWDVASESSAQISVGSKAWTCLAIDPTGAFVAIGDSTGVVTLLSADPQKSQELVALGQPVSDIRFDRSSSKLISIAVDGQMRIWDLPIPTPNVIEKITGSDGLFAISPNGRQIATSGESGKITVRVISGTAETKVFSTSIDKPTALDFIGENGLAVANREGQIEMIQDAGHSQVLSAGESEITHLSSAGERLISSTDVKGQTKIWSIGQRVAGELGEQPIAAASADDQVPVLGIASQAGKLFIYDLTRSEVTASWQAKGSPIVSLAINSRKGIVTTGHQSGQIKLWSIRSPGEPVELGSFKTPARVIRLNASASHIYAGSEDGKVGVWATKVAVSPAATQLTLAKEIQSARFSEETPFGTVATDDSVHSVDMRDGQLLLISDAGKPAAAALSGDGTNAAVVDADGMLTLKDMPSGNNLAQLTISDDRVVDVCFAPLDRDLLTLHSSGQVKRWQVPTTDTGRLKKKLEGTRSLAVNASGTVLAAAGKAEVRFLSLPGFQDLGAPVKTDGSLDRICWIGNEVLLHTSKGTKQFSLIDAATGRSRKAVIQSPSEISAMGRLGNTSQVLAVAGKKLLRISLSTSDLLVNELSFEASPADQLATSGNSALLLSSGRLFRITEDGTIALDQSSMKVNKICSSMSGASAVLLQDSLAISVHDGEKIVDVGTSSEPIFDAAQSEDGKFIAVWTNVGKCSIWSVAEKRIVQSIPASPNGPTLISWLPGNAGLLQTFEGAATSLVPLIPRSEWSSNLKTPLSMQTSQSGDRILVRGADEATVITTNSGVLSKVNANRDDFVQLLDSDDGVVVASKSGLVSTLIKGKTASTQLENSVTGLCVNSSSASIIVSINEGKELKCLEIETLKPRESISLESPVHQLSTCPLGTLAIAANGQIKVIEQQTNSADTMVDGHQGPCTGLVLSGGRIWTSGRDGSVRKWSADLLPGTDYYKHGKPIASIRKAADSGELILTDGSGTVLTLSTTADPATAHPGLVLPPGSEAISRDSKSRTVVVSPRKISRLDPNSRDLSEFRLEGDVIDAGQIATQDRWYVVVSTGKILQLEFANGVSLPQQTANMSGQHGLANQEFIFVSGSTIQKYEPDGRKLGTASLGDVTTRASGLSVDQKFLAIAMSGGEIAVFETSTLKQLAKFKSDLSANAVSVDDAGEYVLLAGGVNRAEEWDVRKGVRLRSLTGHSAIVRSARYVHGTANIVTSSEDGEVRQWPKSKIYANQLSSKDSVGLRLLPNGDGAVSISTAGIISISDSEGKTIWVSSRPVKSLQHIALSEDGNAVALLQSDAAKKSVTIHNKRSGEDKTFSVPDATSSICFDSAGLSVVISTGSQIEFREIESDKTTLTLNLEATECLLADDKHLLYVGTDGLLHNSGSSQLGQIRISKTAVTSVAYDDQGDRLVTGNKDGVITLWSITDGNLKSIVELDAGSPVRQLILSGEVLVARTDKPAISVWLLGGNVNSQMTSVDVLHPDVPTNMRLDFRQEFLATVGQNNAVYVWYLNVVQGQPRKVLSAQGLDSSIVAMAFTNETRALVTIDRDATVAFNELPDRLELRSKLESGILMGASAGKLEELPKTASARQRSGNDLLTQQLRAEDKFRRDRLIGKQEPGVPRAASRRLAADSVQSMGEAHSVHLRGHYQDRIANGTDHRKPQNLASNKWKSSDVMVQEYEKIESLPIEVSAAAKNATKSSSGTGVTSGKSAEVLQRQLVDSQRSFVRMLEQSSFDSLPVPTGPTRANDQLAFQKQLEQLTDSRAVQTIQTNYPFPDSDQASIQSIGLQISRDGRTVISVFPPVNKDDSLMPGRIDIWDMLSGIPLKQFDVQKLVNQTLLTPAEDLLVTLPEVNAYRLFENKAPQMLTRAANAAQCRFGPSPIVAFGKQTAEDKQDELIQLFYADSLEPLPLAMPEGFNARSRAIAFANNEDLIAFSVSERGEQHKLFVCKVTELPSFELMTPVGEAVNAIEGDAGVSSLAFSHDDRYLAALVQTTISDDAHASIELFERKNGNWSHVNSVPLDPKAFSGADQEVSMSFVAGLNRILVRTGRGLFLGDMTVVRKKKDKKNSAWKIPFLPGTDQSMTVTEDSHWAAIGKVNGALTVYDLTSAHPEVAAKLPLGGDTAHDGPILGIAFSRPLSGMSDPTYLTTFGRENRIKVWSMVDLKERYPAQQSSGHPQNR